MKPHLLILLTIILPRLASAQFCIVSDKDGFTNVRNAADIKSQITDTLNNGRLIHFLTGKDGDNWINIEYRRKNKEYQGYVYHDRLKPIHSYDSVPPEAYDENVAVYRQDYIKVSIAQQKFIGANYRFSYFKQAPNQIELINGKQYWRTDADVPKTEYRSIVIVIGSRKTTLPKAALDNLFGPNIGHEEVSYDRENDVFMAISGAGHT